MLTLVAMKIVYGNWKMNGTPGMAKEWEQGFSPTANVDTALFVPHTMLSAWLGVPLGAQDVSVYENTGAYTGEVSATLAAEVGAGLALCGHSERRHGLKESNAIVKQKAENALRAGLKVVLCVGEPLDIRESGSENAYVEKQLKESWPEGAGAVVIAYEPVWAIGTGKVASLEQIAAMHAHIKRVAPDPKIPILYGGSVGADTARDIMNVDNVDGVLVGGASLKPDQFQKICEAAL